MATIANISSTPEPTARALPTAGIVALGAVYISWGLTWLAIRLAVRPGAGFTPFWMGASRIGVAGLLLLGWCALRRMPIKLSAQQFRVIAPAGLSMWVVSHGLVMWGAQHAPSGLTALLFSSMTVWVAIIESILNRRMIGKLMAASILLGFVGMGVLSWPKMQGVDAIRPMVLVALILAPLFWGVGSIIQSRLKSPVPSLVAAAWQMILSGACFAMLAVAFGDPLPTPTPTAWGAWCFLVVFGAMVGYGCYIIALEKLPIQVVMTYPYVNPVIAVISGAIAIAEPITGSMIVGSLMMLAGVAGVFKARYGGSS